MITAKRSLLVISLALMGLSANTQVFIADQGYRDALKAAVPGLVDGAGMMDTAHPRSAEGIRSVRFVKRWVSRSPSPVVR